MRRGRLSDRACPHLILFQLAGRLAMISNAKKSNGSHDGWKALNEPLEKFSHWVTAWSGSSWAFTSALAIILIWAACGPIFHYSDTWQLVINTGTTIVTFLMVFLIQRSQNKD